MDHTSHWTGGSRTLGWPAKSVCVTEKEVEMFFNVLLCRRSILLPSSSLLQREHKECSSKSKLFRQSSQRVISAHFRGTIRLSLGFKPAARKWCPVNSKQKMDREHHETTVKRGGCSTHLTWLKHRHATTGAAALHKKTAPSSHPVKE